MDDIEPRRDLDYHLQPPPIRSKQKKNEALEFMMKPAIPEPTEYDGPPAYAAIDANEQAEYVDAGGIDLMPVVLIVCDITSSVGLIFVVYIMNRPSLPLLISLTVAKAATLIGSLIWIAWDGKHRHGTGAIWLIVAVLLGFPGLSIWLGLLLYVVGRPSRRI